MKLKHVFSGLADAGSDFRSASWGMSKKEVRRSEGFPPLGEGEGYITYRERVMGLDAVVGFQFREALGAESIYITEYGKVKGILSRSYGEPAIDEDICAACGMCGKGCRCGDAAWSEQSLVFLSEWMTGRSVIRLVLMGEGGGFDFGVLHRSREHARLFERGK